MGDTLVQFHTPPPFDPKEDVMLTRPFVDPLARAYNRPYNVEKVGPWLLSGRRPWEEHGIQRRYSERFSNIFHTFPNTWVCCGKDVDHPGCWMGRKKHVIEPYDAFKGLRSNKNDLSFYNDSARFKTLWNQKQLGTMWLDQDFYVKIDRQIQELKTDQLGDYVRSVGDGTIKFTDNVQMLQTLAMIYALENKYNGPQGKQMTMHATMEAWIVHISRDLGFVPDVDVTLYVHVPSPPPSPKAQKSSVQPLNYVGLDKALSQLNPNLAISKTFSNLVAILKIDKNATQKDVKNLQTTIDNVLSTIFDINQLLSPLDAKTRDQFETQLKNAKNVPDLQALLLTLKKGGDTSFLWNLNPEYFQKLKSDGSNRIELYKEQEENLAATVAKGSAERQYHLDNARKAELNLRASDDFPEPVVVEDQRQEDAKWSLKDSYKSKLDSKESNRIKLYEEQENALAANLPEGSAERQYHLDNARKAALNLRAVPAAVPGQPAAVPTTLNYTKVVALLKKLELSHPNISKLLKQKLEELVESTPDQRAVDIFENRIQRIADNADRIEKILVGTKDASGFLDSVMVLTTIQGLEQLLLTAERNLKQAPEQDETTGKWPLMARFKKDLKADESNRIELYRKQEEDADDPNLSDDMRNFHQSRNRIARLNLRTRTNVVEVEDETTGNWPLKALFKKDLEADESNRIELYEAQEINLANGTDKDFHETRIRIAQLNQRK